MTSKFSYIWNSLTGNTKMMKAGFANFVTGNLFKKTRAMIKQLRTIRVHYYLFLKRLKKSIFVDGVV